MRDRSGGPRPRPSSAPALQPSPSTGLPFFLCSALERSEQSFRKLIEGAPESICVHRNQRYVYVNPAMEQQFGVLAADLPGREGGAGMPEHLARTIRDHDPQLLAVGLPVEMIAAVPQADGCPVSENGELPGSEIFPVSRWRL